MTHPRSVARDLDDLIAEITVDCNGDDEALASFEVAFDNDVRFPLPATVVGEDVRVLSVGLVDGRPELIATCERAGLHYRIALLDVDPDADAATMRLLNAYRRWLGA